MTGALYKLGGFAARRARWVFVVWIVLAVALVLIADGTGRPTSDDPTIPGSDSTRATNLLEQKLPKQANGTVPIVLEAPSGKLTTGANRKAVQAAVDSLKRNRYVRDLVSPLTSEGSGQLAEKDTVGFISLYLTLGTGDINDDEANEIFDAADPAADAGLEVSAGGYLGSQLSEPSTRLSEIVGIVAAMIVLVFVLGTVLAMVMPITTALVGVFSGLALVGIAGTAITVPSIAPTLAIMLGLGVGIDYSLFVVTRHRRLLDDGHPVPEAVARAIATSGGAVVFAGSTVILSLLCLYFGGIPQVRDLGYSAAIAVAVVIVAALTLLPAGLALLGERINSLRVRRQGHKEGSAEEAASGWARWGSFVGRHPLLAAIAGIVLLVVLALPVTEIEPRRPGQRPDAGVDDNPPVLRRARPRLRPRLQRPAAGRGRHEASGEAGHEEGRPAREPATAAGRAGAAGGRAGDARARGGGRAAGGGPAGGDGTGAGAGAEPEAAGPVQPGARLLQVAGERPAAGQAREPDHEGRRRRRRSCRRR